MKLVRNVFVFALLLGLPAAVFAAEPVALPTPGYDAQTGQIILPSETSLGDEYNYLYQLQPQEQLTPDPQTTDAQYQQYQNSLEEAEEERARILQWEKMDKEIKLRRYDELVFDMRKDFEGAKAATNPFIGEQGYVIYPYGEVVPVITCRPLRMTDIALEPGESIMGIHAGDTTRWQFSPSQSMKNGLAVAHIVVKPLQPGISTNLLIHTDRRTYNLDFTSTDGANYLRGVAFSYQSNGDLSSLFVGNTPAANSNNAGNKNSRSGSRSDKALEDEIQSGMNGVELDDLYTQYKIDNKSKVDWRPDAVFDDGSKTYLRMPLRMSETPAFYIVLDRKSTLANYRVKGRYYIVDRLFDKAYLRIGAKTVTITRRDKLIDSNIKASREEEIIRLSERRGAR